MFNVFKQSYFYRLTLARIDPKNKKSFMFNIFKQLHFYTMHNLYPSFDFDATNSPRLHCFGRIHTKQCYTISKFSLK